VTKNIFCSCTYKNISHFFI